MMPYATYRLYQAERTKSSREIHNADQWAAQLAAAVSGLFRAITQTARRPHPAAPGGPSPRSVPAGSPGAIARAMQNS